MNKRSPPFLAYATIHKGIIELLNAASRASMCDDGKLLGDWAPNCRSRTESTRRFFRLPFRLRIPQTESAEFGGTLPNEKAETLSGTFTLAELAKMIPLSWQLTCDCAALNSTLP